MHVVLSVTNGTAEFNTPRSLSQPLNLATVD
uniref:Uncharacterized protein n=1 Tax=Anguilla anguilla TaxID=7936 RepID=A0A0E9TTK1_ANGAN